MTQNNSILIAILFGFILVAGAIFLSADNRPVSVVAGIEGDLEVKRSGDNAWTYGNKKALTTIVEFSDYECPYCSRVHPTIKQLVDESDGTIAWQYRHFPLPSHKNAEEAAVVAECVGLNAGNDAFWSYTDNLFANQRQIDTDFIVEAAKAEGLAEEDVSSCLGDDDILAQIKRDQSTSRALGGSGTPFSVIVKPDGSIKTINGALPIENWRAVLSE